MDRKIVIRRIQEQLQWKSPNGRIMNIITIPRDHAESVLEDLIHLMELHPKQVTF
jgi:hypothetical protein